MIVWAGSLWTVCGIVAPSLFNVLSDRKLAGDVAGHFFRLECWIGLALGGVALALLARGAVSAKRFDFALVATAMAGPLASELAVRPLMNAARTAGDMSRFGLLHGVSALLFLAACVSLLLLVWRLSAAKT